MTVENGAKLCVKSVEMNNLKVRAGSVVKAENLDVQIGAEILNYGTVYTDKFTCGNVRQDALNSKLIVTGKLVVTEGNDSYLYSAGINSFEVKGTLKDLLGNKISAYKSDAFYVTGSSVSSTVVEGGNVKDYIKDKLDVSLNKSNEPISVRQTYVDISNKDFSTEILYNGMAATGPSCENFDTNNTEVTAAAWTFTWYAADGTEIKDVADGKCPTDAGLYVLKVSLDETENYPAESKEFEVCVYKDEVEVIGESLNPESDWFTSEVTLSVTDDNYKLSETSGGALSDKIVIDNTMDGDFDYYLVAYGKWIKQKQNLKIDLTGPAVDIKVKNINSNEADKIGDNEYRISEGVYISVTGTKEEGSVLDSAKVVIDDNEVSRSSIDAGSVELLSKTIKQKGTHNISYELKDLAGHIVSGSATIDLYEHADITVTTSDSVYYDGNPVEAGKDFTVNTISDGELTYYYKTLGADDDTYVKGLPADRGQYTVKIEMSADKVDYFESTSVTFDINIIYDITEVASKTATCVEEGNIQYYYVKAIDKYFTDEECNNEISASAITIEKI